MAVYFLSDLHLGVGSRAEDRQREQRFIQLLQAIRPTATHLVLLGDIFDYWFEYNTVVQRQHIRTLALLADIADSGLPIDYVMGNHDFGHRDFFQDELGIHLHRNDIERCWFGKKFYLAHGDGKVANDTGYLILRSILRNKLAQSLFRWIHPDIGIALAASTSKNSRKYTDAKEYGTPDGLRPFALQTLAKGYDYVVMGHRHSPAIEQTPHGTYVNLGDLVKNETFASFDGNDMVLHTVQQFLDKHSGR